MFALLKIITLFIFFSLTSNNVALADLSSAGFDLWLSSYKEKVLKEGISKKTVDITFKNAKFLEQVIKYDRKQPEFFEDTKTYVNKRATKSRSN